MLFFNESPFIWRTRFQLFYIKYMILGLLHLLLLASWGLFALLAVLFSVTLLGCFWLEWGK